MAIPDPEVTALKISEIGTASSILVSPFSCLRRITFLSDMGFTPVISRAFLRFSNSSIPNTRGDSEAGFFSSFSSFGVLFRLSCKILTSSSIELRGG